MMPTTDFIRSLYHNGTNGLSHQRIRRMNSRQRKKLGVYPYGQNVAELEFYFGRLPTAEDLKAFYALPLINQPFTQADQNRYADYSADEESTNVFLDIVIAAAEKYNCAVTCAVSVPITLHAKNIYLSEKKRQADLPSFRRMLNTLYDGMSCADRLCGSVVYHSDWQCSRPHTRSIFKFDYIERQERQKEIADEANK